MASISELNKLTKNNRFFSFVDDFLKILIFSNVIFLLNKKLKININTEATESLESKMSSEAYSSIAFNGKLKKP